MPTDKEYRMTYGSRGVRLTLAAACCVFVAVTAAVLWPFVLVWGIAKGVVMSTAHVALGVSSICLQIVQDNLED